MPSLARGGSADPEAGKPRLPRVELVDGPRRVRARAARGEERERLWDCWREIDKGLDAQAARRSMETAVVILEAPEGVRPGG